MDAVKGIEELPNPPSPPRSPRWLGRYLPNQREALHAFLMGTHPKVGVDSLIRMLPSEMILEIFSFFRRDRLFRVTGLTTPWNEDHPWTDNSWCMEVAWNPFTGIIYGEGTNIGMDVLKKYNGTIQNNIVDCLVHFPTTGQKSSYKGSITDGKINLRIEILDPGKTSGVRGDFKYATGNWVEVFEDEFPAKKAPNNEAPEQEMAIDGEDDNPQPFRIEINFDDVHPDALDFAFDVPPVPSAPKPEAHDTQDDMVTDPFHMFTEPVDWETFVGLIPRVQQLIPVGVEVHAPEHFHTIENREINNDDQETDMVQEDQYL